ncbi:hypothetical protein KUCAC02_035036, partial [Chaenocephalus aceratus]
NSSQHPGRESEPSVRSPRWSGRRSTRVDSVRDTNEILLLGNKAKTEEELPSNVLMAHASEDSIFNKTEVLAGFPIGVLIS